MKKQVILRPSLLASPQNLSEEMQILEPYLRSTESEQRACSEACFYTFFQVILMHDQV